MYFNRNLFFTELKNFSRNACFPVLALGEGKEISLWGKNEFQLKYFLFSAKKKNQICPKERYIFNSMSVSSPVCGQVIRGWRTAQTVCNQSDL